MTTPNEPGGPKSKLDQARMTAIWGDLFALEQPPDKAKVVENEAGMKLALIPYGAFPMGADPEDEPVARPNEGPRRTVVIATEFYIGVYPVTQAEYQRVTGKNPSLFTPEAGGGPAHPVERVSWDDAAAFCRALSDLPGERKAGRTYRLPTEAEWEFACRAGATTAYTFGATLDPTQANYGGGYGPDGAPRPPAVGRTTPVGAYPANHYGLYDLHGNVWEWCGDWYDERYYEDAPLRDPTGPPAGQFRCVRGGCWRSLAGSCRAAYRNALVPNNRDPYTGFRVVAVVARKDWPGREESAVPRVLLVEDNEMNRDMLARRLQKKGHEVAVAADGIDGIARARADRPDVILMDLSLPGIDGLEATRQLKADPDTRGIPVVLLTAHALAGDREAALAAGCDGYDTKPIDLPRLLDTIATLTAGRTSS